MAYHKLNIVYKTSLQQWHTTTVSMASLLKHQLRPRIKGITKNIEHQTIQLNYYNKQSPRFSFFYTRKRITSESFSHINAYRIWTWQGPKTLPDKRPVIHWNGFSRPFVLICGFYSFDRLLTGLDSPKIGFPTNIIHKTYL